MVLVSPFSVKDRKELRLLVDHNEFLEYYQMQLFETIELTRARCKIYKARRILLLLVMFVVGQSQIVNFYETTLFNRSIRKYESCLLFGT